MHLKNAFKYCPGCGKKTLQHNAEENFLFCPFCGFQYFINASAAVAAIIQDTEGRILFTVRAKDPAAGMLDLPGGFVDVGETAEQALHREIKEELGLKLASVRYFTSRPNTYTYHGITYNTLDITYICKAEDLKTIEAKDDITDFVFLYADEINPEQLGLASMKAIISHYLQTYHS